MISRRVNAERVVVLGWSRAILLQLAHPLMAAAVAEHSSFRGGAIAAVRRLRRTIRAMLAITFGTDDEAAGAIAGILAIHRRVNGRLGAATGPFPAGTPYSAEDPDLVCWVHVTLAESVLLVYERFVRPLIEAERDRYCDEIAGVALALGARTTDVPRTFAALTARIDAERHSGRLVVGAEARDLANAVLFPPAGIIGWPLARLNAFITVGLLPGDLRRQYGFAWSSRRAAWLDALARLSRRVRPWLPRALALWSPARQPIMTADAGSFLPHPSSRLGDGLGAAARSRLHSR